MMKSVAIVWGSLVAIIMTGFGIWMVPTSLLVAILSIGSSGALIAMAVLLVKNYHGVQ